jgi:glycosidase
MRTPTTSAWRDDWRCGPIVYHAMVDRFVPSADLAAKRALYPPPKRLMAWSDQPRRGKRLEGVTQGEHEMAFWGGDLPSLRTRLGYLEDLGIDVLYLNPIHRAVTNHKYDALDYLEVSPEYGTADDVRGLADDLHARGMRLMLDGVFNHVSAEHPRFRAALADPAGEAGAWFYLGEQEHRGYRGWHDSRNLPELNLENPETRAHVIDGPDAAVRHWLRLGADGWRLDVAYDLGHDLLGAIRDAAEQERGDAWVVGEMWSYPGAWTGCLHGVMNFHARQLVFGLIRGQIRGGHAARMLERMVADAGIDGTLRSWLVLDNHDTGRLASVFPDPDDRLLAQALQFTLPGCPLVYYGVEAGMVGGQDPECRGPMEWDARARRATRTSTAWRGSWRCAGPTRRCAGGGSTGSTATASWRSSARGRRSRRRSSWR